jgi:uncharacterized protein involved in tellurium resistance
MIGVYLFFGVGFLVLKHVVCGVILGTLRLIFLSREGNMQRIKVEINDQYGSQRKFAQSIGLHETTVSNILSGAMEPSDDQKQMIVKALGLKWNKLIENI